MRQSIRDAVLTSVLFASAHGVGLAASNPPPEITAVSILTPTINVATAPGQPKLRVNFKAGPAGLASIGYVFHSAKTDQYFSVYNSFGEAPRSGRLYLRSTYTGGPGNITGLTSYSIPGTWTLLSMNACDWASQCVSYSDTTLGKIVTNPNITVVNHGKPDITAPTVTGATFLTKSVSRSSDSPFIRIAVQTSDDLSGIAYGLAFISKDSGPSYQLQGRASAPWGNSSLGLYLEVNRDTPTGKYTVVGLKVFDVPGNTYFVSDAAQIKALFAGRNTMEVVS